MAFVLNPQAPLLSTSPGRKFIARRDNTSNGLLKIKCPSKDKFKYWPYLIKYADDGSDKLKLIHTYHFQIMGQLGVTGMAQCDFFVMCTKEYHVQRIHFDAAE